MHTRGVTATPLRVCIMFLIIQRPIVNYSLHIYTLTGHFIRYTLLVPGWTPFCLQNCLNSSWHSFNKVLETFLRDFGPYWHDSITQLRISRSTTSQRCSIGLRSGDCGGHLSKVNSLSCSRNQSEMIWALWHGALSCWKLPSEDWYTVIKNFSVCQKTDLPHTELYHWLRDRPIWLVLGTVEVFLNSSALYYKPKSCSL